MKRPILIALFALSLAACHEEEAVTPDPVALTDEALSYFCQMNVADHAGPKAQIHLDGYPEPLFFAQVRDAVAYLKGPERDAAITAVYVSNMAAAESWAVPGVDNWIDANGAVFVVGAPVRGGMGAPEIVPFATRTGADAFIARYGGKAMTLDAIPADAAVGLVDLNIPLEEPT